MKVVIQRVKQAQVSIKGKIVSSIGYGSLFLICFERKDKDLELSKVADKLISLRYFTEIGTSKMNKNILEIGGEVLSVSQFTLSWDGKKGNRPSFDNSMDADFAKIRYDEFNSLLAKKIDVKTNGRPVSKEQKGRDKNN